MEEELRRVRSDLMLSGVGLMLFGIWDFVKMLLYCLFAGDRVDQLLEVSELEPEWRIFVEAIWMFSAFVSMLLYLYVGFCAFREGKSGKLRRRGYRFLAVMGIWFGGYTMVTGVVAFVQGRMEFMELLSQLLLGAGTISALWSLSDSTLRLRKLTNKKEAAGHAD